MQIIHKIFETGGAVFPEFYVAVKMLIAVYYCLKYVRGLFIVYLLIFIFLNRLKPFIAGIIMLFDVIVGIIDGIFCFFCLGGINPVKTQGRLKAVDNQWL